MREVFGEELKQLQIGILDCFADFCEKNDIKYWLDYGTLLGAVRHKGYIPWDDDIDIGMLRYDYDRLSKSFNSFNERYQFYNIDTNPDFRYAFGKIIDTRTELYEPDINGIKFNINIDVFVYDNIPSDSKIVRQLYRKRDFFNKLNTIKYISLKNSVRDRGIIKTGIILWGKIALIPFPSNYFAKCINRNAKKYAFVQTHEIGNYYQFESFTAPKYFFDEMIKVTFEGKEYTAPKYYHEWLTKIYGDYMKCPPIEQCKSHHRFKAYIFE